MSKINAFRLINLNYNNNAIQISDECLHFNGESTLLSLRNGGGKSVLVQMMMAPFVHKRYRDAKDRPFESYFTTNKPSFILVEWVLDQGAGYVMAGIMVRKSQDLGEPGTENLEMINIISEYREPCLQDIRHLPVVEKGKKEMVLKNFTACRQLFESYKKDRSTKFFYYDMGNPAQSRQYFDKLMEYQINYKEWESIIKKVNLKESGLSDLFADCRDEKGLVEKWFLDAVESKLNKEKNRMNEFRMILEKYVGQYKDNQSKIKRRDTIRVFQEEAAKIQEKARLYQEAGVREREQENLVAHFIEKLNQLNDLTEEEYQGVLERLVEIQQAADRVEYEELSSIIHGLEEQKRFHAGNRDMVGMEQEGLEREAERMEEGLHLMACAKQQKVTDEDREELEGVRQKLLISRKKDQNLEPERNYLGYALKCHYEKRLAANGENQEKSHQRLQETVENIGREKEKIADLGQRIRDTDVRKGALRAKIEVYDQQEDRYNTRYGEQLARNILGEYEPGALGIRLETYESELEEKTRECLGRRKQLESGQESRKRLERSLEDMRGEQIKRKADKEQKKKQQDAYERELDARRVVLRYLELGENLLFDRQKLLYASERKRMEIAGLRRNLEKEEDRLQKEYQRLTQGKVLDIPEELEDELVNMGIHRVYGMEWLRKNGYSQEQNTELVRCHPFLPYALILSTQELEKLSRHAGNIYTSFPIPIIVREQLEGKETEYEGSVIQMQGVSFYVLFNENLLDEEKLHLLVQKKEQEIQQIKGLIQIRQTEYEEYFARQELIRNQAVTKELYEENRGYLDKMVLLIEGTEVKIREASRELDELKIFIEQLGKDNQSAEKEIACQKRRLQDYQELCTEYESYGQNRKALEQCQKEGKRFQENQKSSQTNLENLLEGQKTLDAQSDNLYREMRQLQNSAQHYRTYEKAEDWKSDMGEEAMDAVEMEARYSAITANISQELQELESQEKKAVKRYDESADELKHLQKKYRLNQESWSGVSYDRKEETHQEALLEDRKIKIEQKKALWNEEERNIAVIFQQLTECMKRMQSECGKETPLPKSEIQNRDFDARINRLKHQKKEMQNRADKLKSQLESYGENLAALSEYDTFPMQNDVAWEQDFAQMNNRELRDFKGTLLREYNQRVSERQGARERLTGILNQIVRMELFQDDYYRKPLEAMLELTGDADQVLQQLDTTIQSYEYLMEKLEVDISLVEREKNKIVDLLEEYIREVHQNLEKIDQNSTITIRERPVKMLKIQLPQWEENESLYRMRIQDLVDEITHKGVEIFERNENAQEYFGIQVTTKNLYDTVIGIENVQIRLYKIEEQREYQITWAEVARNSGGEGFLSAFVILSSLLYYMRKDDTDIFADRNAGKVLLMDNPFAQTNAAHLLKPLMDMAKKTNTQLICLTGLGGDSIYNRFDNIYVLNLIAASLRNGMQYLRADHLRGNEPETLLVSQIEVMEQQELAF